MQIFIKLNLFDYLIWSIQIEILDFYQNLSDQLIGHFPNKVILFNPRLPACKDFPNHNRVNLKLVNKKLIIWMSLIILEN